jgi:four helix bundle protein
MEPLLKAPGAESIQAPRGIAAASRPQRVVWERAADLALEVLRVSARAEGVEPALRDPLRSAALAVPTSLARAHGRAGRYARPHLATALGALAELESHLALAGRLGDPPPDGVGRLRGMVEVVRRLIVALAVRDPDRRAPGAPAP